MTNGRPPQQRSVTVAGLGTAMSASLVLAVVAASAALLVGGRQQLNGALLGVALVAGFFLFGTLSTSVAAAYAPGTALIVALLTYTTQIVVLGLVLAVLRGSAATAAALDNHWLAGTVIIGTLCWTAALVTHAVRSQHKISSIGAAGR